MQQRFRHLSLTAFGVALIAVGSLIPAAAQDSGVGTDLHFGNSLQPEGLVPLACDPDGMSWLTAARKRTPSGQLYLCPPDFTQPRALESGDWLFSGVLGLGYLSTDDENNTNWLRFNNWSDGLLATLDLSLVQPDGGSYLDLRASRIDSDNQYLKMNAGRSGLFRIEAFARSQVNVTSGVARSIWEGVGSDYLSLKPGLTPGGSSGSEVAAVSAAAPEQVLKVVRDKYGVGINYFIDRRFTAYANIAQEEREGARPFGGPFFFAFIFPGSGGVYETPRPVDDSTLNANGGLRYVGSTWNWDIGYSGSFFRHGYQRFSYEVPFAFPPLAPGFNNFPLTLGEFAYEPENDYHGIRGTLTRKLPDNGQFSMTASWSTSRQDDDLLPPMNCSGLFGLDVAPFTFNCADWNSIGSLSRTSADLSINSTLLDAKLVLQPTARVTLRGNLKFHRQDYRGDYFAFNPLTGQYGYIAENGAQGSSVPGEMGVWDPVLFPDVLTRVRNLPLDKEIHEGSIAADWRLSSRDTLSTALTFTRTERRNREVEDQDDWLLLLGWSTRATDDLTLRINYTYLDRHGHDYNYDPYEFTFSSSLPGFVDPGTMPPHTVDALRKYDVGGNRRHKATLIATYALSGYSTISGNLRGEWNDYDAELGRRGYDSRGASLQWDWQPGENVTANGFLGYDRSNLAIANVNDATAGVPDPALGGTAYPQENRWWVDDEQRNYYAGLKFSAVLAMGRLDLGWNYSDSRGLTSYTFNSPGALAYPALAAQAGNGFSPMLFRINTWSVSWSREIGERVTLRIFDTYERGRLSDWHYLGLDSGLVTSNRVYLDRGPEDYSANMIGLMLEARL